MLPKISTVCIFVVLTCFAMTLQAEQKNLRHFVSGSYQDLLAGKDKRPLVLTIWSTTCSTCMQKMPLLKQLYENRSDIHFVMLSTDDVSASNQVTSVLKKHQLTDVESWVFAEKNAQKLRYEIDPTWFGELPRTYFFSKSNERVGISGAISQQNYEAIFKKMLN